MSTELLNHFQSKRQSIEERIAIGKDLRKKFPRIKQGEYKTSVNRLDPVSILMAQGETRLPDLVPIRYARMLTSPFGSCFDFDGTGRDQTARPGSYPLCKNAHLTVWILFRF